MSRLLLQHGRGPIRSLAHAQGVFKMACYGDVRCKQNDVIEFIVAERELITNINKRLRMYMLWTLLIRALLVAGLHELQGLTMTKRRLATSIALGNNSKSLKCCFKAVFPNRLSFAYPLAGYFHKFYPSYNKMFVINPLTLIQLTWRIWWAPNNASRWQMGFNSALKGSKTKRRLLYLKTQSVPRCKHFSSRL